MKTKTFLIAIVSVFALFQGVKADTVSITMQPGSTIKSSRLDTYIIYKPIGVPSSCMFYVNTIPIGFGDSAIFTPSQFDDFVITAVWNGMAWGMVFSFEKELVQNDSIWVTSGKNILAIGSHEKDAYANGVISRHGDLVMIPEGSPISLTINSTRSIHHVLWVANDVSSLGDNSHQLTITVTPIMSTDYTCYVYQDVDGQPVLMGNINVHVTFDKK